MRRSGLLALRWSNVDFAAHAVAIDAGLVTTLMVRDSADVGELRAVADILGHSPDMLMKVYAHTLPESLRSVTAKIGSRAVP